jgi:Carboxypeptidase regulatory-like domain
MTLIGSLTATNWTAIGPAPIDAPGVGLGLAAGRVESAVANPGKPQTVYAAGNDGGVWKTTDWAADPPYWTPLGDTQESLNYAGYHPLVVHPAHHDRILGVVCGHGAGVLRSINAGVSWHLLGNSTLDGAAIGSIAVHPTDTQILYVSLWYGASGGGVYKSTDGGHTWTKTTSFHSGGASDVVIAKSNPNTLYAGLVDYYGGAATAGVYKTTNGGALWKLMTGLPSGTKLGGAVRLESATKAGHVYVSYFTKKSGNTIVERSRTSNGGQTWTKLHATPGAPETRSWHLLLGVDPLDEKHVFANDAYQLFESHDGGASWTSAETIGDDWVNISFDSKGIALVTADRDLYRYEPKPKLWKSKEANMQVTLFYDITPDPSNPDIVYGVSQDHPFAMKFDGTLEWAYVPKGGETGKVVIDPGSTNRIYVSNPLDPANLVARSTDWGLNWKTIFTTTTFSAGDYDLAYSTQRSFAIDMKKPTRLLIGTTKVWETKNATAANPTWAPISGILGGSTAAEQYITALAIAPSDSKTVYAATADGHVWDTSNGGTSWSACDTGLYGAGAGRIVDIRIDPSNPKHCFAVGSGQGSVWHLEEVAGTLQWTNISGDLPTYLWFGSILPDWQYATPALYLGTSNNVYHSVNLGSHWSVFAADMPNTNVTDLQSTSADILYAGTFGRGAWAIRIGPAKLTGIVAHWDEIQVAHVGPGDPVEGVLVTLEAEGGGGPVATAVTNSKGVYAFDGVAPGDYTVTIKAPPGFVALDDSPGRVSLRGSGVRSLDFGYRFDPALAAAAKPYAHTANLVVLPGRRPENPVAAKDEFKSLPRKKAMKS